MHVAREHEIERARRQEVEDVREVTQQDPQLRAFVQQGPGLRGALAIRARVDTYDLHPVAAHVDRLALVDEQPCGSKVGQPGCARERIAAVLDVVIP